MAEFNAQLEAIRNICLAEIEKNLKDRNLASKVFQDNMVNYHQGKINAFTQILELIEKRLRDRV
jgi:hypothetical protein